jgi:hypothetical protein
MNKKSKYARKQQGAKSAKELPRKEILDRVNASAKCYSFFWVILVSTLRDYFFDSSRRHFPTGVKGGVYSLGSSTRIKRFWQS